MRWLGALTVATGFVAAAACSLVASVDGIADDPRQAGVDGPQPDGAVIGPDGGDVDASCGDTTSSADNCGSCGNACQAPPGASVGCERGECVSTCVPPMLDCDDALAANGCETNANVDPSRCGACDIRCAETTCQAGYCAPKTIGPFARQPGDMVTDGERLYWVSYDKADGGAWTAPVDGGGLAVAFAVKQLGSWRIAMDDQNVYWSNPDGNTIMTAAKGGINPRVFAPVTDAGPPPAGPWGVAVDADYVFWMNTQTKTLMRAKKDRSAPTVIFTDPGALVGEIAMDETTIYWADAFGSIKSCAKDGGNFRRVVPTTGGIPVRLAVDATSVYWTEINPGRVQRVNKDGSNLVTLAVKLNTPATIVLDATHVYFTEDPATDGGIRGRVLRMRKDGSDLREVAVQQWLPRGLAVDSKYLFWAEYHPTLGQVKRLLKTW